MSSIKQKFCEKIGISEASIKSNSIFSDNKPSQIRIADIKSPSIRFGGSNKSTSNASKSMSGFEHSKMDLLVPNSQPPTPQIRSLKTESRYTYSPEYKKKKSNELDTKLHVFSPANYAKKPINASIADSKSKFN